jgi:uncharacterized DUF497 family protein
MRDVVHELLPTRAAAEKLGRRGITLAEVRQLPRNQHLVFRNPRSPGSRLEDRRLIVGRTNGARTLTLVIERTADPTHWLVVTGWDSANHERRMI